jgi:hypothetical protein
MRSIGATVVAAVALASASAASVSFGIYDAQESPGGGWQIASAADITANKAAFVESYNANKGLKLVKTFKGGNCCIAVKGGLKLTVSDTAYNTQFPAATTGGIRCNPPNGYDEAYYQFYKSPQLTEAQEFGEKEACVNNHNPAVFIRSDEVAAVNTIQFGLYDLAVAPAGGWHQLSADVLNQYKEEFVNHYNTNNGIDSIDTFQSGNCCMSLAGGLKITISDTKYQFQFPANEAGAIACNPAGGYATGNKYKFYLAPKLSVAQTFAGQAACTTNHNPTIYYKLPPPNVPMSFVQGEGFMYTEFGMYDLQLAPPAGWRLMAAQDFVTYKDAFVATYNAGGLQVIKPFETVNCCIAIKDGLKLTIAGSLYTYQFPATAQDAIRCNPTGGYSGAVYFFKTPKLTTEHVFGAKTACTINHNPAIFMRGGHAEPTAPPTPPPTPAPVVHCTTSTYGDWSACTETCGVGTHSRTRTVTAIASGGGDPCPALREDKACSDQDCDVHCQVSSYGDWDFCNAKCGGGYKTRFRSITAPPVADGDKCPHLSETTECNSQGCPVHCVVSGWSEFSGCSEECNYGLQERRRFVTQTPAYDGTSCPPTLDSQVCNTHACITPAPTPIVPVDCVVSGWEVTSNCDKSCGTGKQLKTRKIITHDSNGGLACGDLDGSDDCNTQACPVDCVEETWSGYSACTVTCGTGFETRTRTIKTAAVNGGAACGRMQEAQLCNIQPCPYDCKVAAYGNFGLCSTSCGEGVKTAHRSVRLVAQHGGKICPSLSTTVACNPGPCPLHCVVSDWTAWSACSASCGSFGQRTRSRSVVDKANHGGDCPSLNDISTCSTQPCPMDCVMSAWSEWDSCTTSCGHGTAAATRTIEHDPQFGGAACSSLDRTKYCNVQGCPVDCALTYFGTWTGCSKTCGSGIDVRTRSIATWPYNGGKACESLHQQVPCAEHACPIDCELSTWSEYSSCTVTCAGGTQERSRQTLVEASLGGIACDTDVHESINCNTGPCPIHCEVTVFTDWTDCTKTCGAGRQSRVRTVTVETAHGGEVCPDLAQHRGCNPEPCPIDCRFSGWTHWGSCSHTCGIGSHSRTRVINQTPLLGGKACPSIKEVQNCNTHACPIDCEVSDFGLWGNCAATCGNTYATRTRSANVDAEFGGKMCPSLSQEMICAVIPCPQDCVLGDFGGWAGCSVSCGGGTEQHTRRVTQIALHGGAACGGLTETRDCNMQQCAIDCVVGAFGDYGACSATCGGGVKTMSRTVEIDAAYGGVICPNLDHNENCGSSDNVACPKDCVLGDWGDWSSCHESCGDAEQTRSMLVAKPAMLGGAVCVIPTQTRTCGSDPCPVHCVVSGWGAWTTCTKTCGKGQQHKERTITTHVLHGGYTCPNLLEQQGCNFAMCPVNCVVDTEWQPWTACSATCGEGVQYRTRLITTRPQYGGKNCDPVSGDRKCNQHACPVDCHQSAWGDWSACTRSCGSGTQSHTRSTNSEPEHGGLACGVHQETRFCNEEQCAVDCQTSAWSDWEPCSKTCGGGMQRSWRSTTAAAEFGGKACIPHEQSRECGAEECPHNCEVSDFSVYSECTKSCGDGTKYRTRTVTHDACHGGRDCPDLEVFQDCNKGPCPVHCETTLWSAWSDCTVTCGRGHQEQTRTVTQQDAHGGSTCPSLSQTQACAPDACPVDCVVGEFGSWTPCSKSCGTGEQYHSRPVVTRAEYDGVACPTLTEEQGCTVLAECPVDCATSAWSAWTACSHTCGSLGEQEQFRSINTFDEKGGKGCPDLSRKRACSTKECPTDCVLSEWTDYTTCTATCGSGWHRRTRSVISQPKLGGKYCTSLSETTNCNTQQCKVDCIMSTPGDLSQWSGCSVTCGSGTRMAALKVLQYASGGGMSCSASVVYETCTAAVAACPSDCQVSNFGAWSSCDKTCDGGKSTRTRSVISDMADGGVACPTLDQERDCNTALCPVHCSQTQVSSWSTCDQSCGGGKSTRSRTTLVHAANGGDECLATYIEKSCNSHPCPFDCVGGWSSHWSSCSATCAGGIQYQNFIALQHARFGGADCDTPPRQQACGEGPCPVHCEVSGWGEWGTCSKSCGITSGGTQTHTRSVITATAHNGQVCPPLEERQQCNKVSCPIHCTTSAWTLWSVCTNACGVAGKHTRTRSVVKHADHGGYVCGDLSEDQDCPVVACPTAAPTKAPTKAPTAAPTPVPTPMNMYKFTQEAEDATSDGMFTNAEAGYHGSGYIKFTDTAHIQMAPTVPTNGRYDMCFRYALTTTAVHTKIVMEHVDLNNHPAIEVKFMPTAAFEWQTVCKVVDLHVGTNTMKLRSPTLKLVDNLFLDQVSIEYKSTLERCRTGKQVPLRWFNYATKRANLLSYARLGSSISGSLEGQIDLGELGPWDITMNVQAPAGDNSQSMDYVHMNVNGETFSSHANKFKAGQEVKNYHFQAAAGMLFYKFEWESTVSDWEKHMVILDGKATCAGCSRTQCEYLEHPTFHLGAIRVTHGRNERFGNKHKCGWNAAYDKCLCSCGFHDDAIDTAGPDAGEWKVTSASPASACVVKDNCVEDHSGDYGANESCEFTYTGPATTIQREQWEFESSSPGGTNPCVSDWVSVNGQKYCGVVNHDATQFPAQMELSTGTTTFSYKSDQSLQFTGFKFCIGPATEASGSGITNPRLYDHASAVQSAQMSVGEAVTAAPTTVAPAATTVAPEVLTSAVAQCFTTDIWKTFEEHGWAQCDEANGDVHRGAYLTSLKKSACGGDGAECVTEAGCCDTGSSRIAEQECYTARFDDISHGKSCSAGYFMTGVWRTDDTADGESQTVDTAFAITAARCCKEQAQPAAWSKCHTATDPWNNGAVKCADGFAIAGFASSGQDLFSLNAVSCCQVTADI